MEDEQANDDIKKLELRKKRQKYAVKEKVCHKEMGFYTRITHTYHVP